MSLLRLSEVSSPAAESPAREIDRLWADAVMASATISVRRTAPGASRRPFGIDARLVAADLRAQARAVEAGMR